VQQLLIAIIPAVVTALGSITVAWVTAHGGKQKK
jgi:hypothetical protein